MLLYHDKIKIQHKENHLVAKKTPKNTKMPFFID